MAIENRNLEPGAKLVARYKKKEYRAEVIEGENGKVRYQLQDGQNFKSLSAAGTAITSKACNGWAFWSMEEPTEAYPWADVADDEPEEVTPQAQESRLDGDLNQPEEKLLKFKRVPNRRGVPEGHVRYYCNECSMSFMASAERKPENCPQGHRPDGSLVSPEHATA